MPRGRPPKPKRVKAEAELDIKLSKKNNFKKNFPTKGPNLSTKNLSCYSFPGIFVSLSFLEKSDPHIFDPQASPGAPLSHLKVLP